MSCTVAHAYPTQTAAGPDLATLFVSLELSKSKWLATVLSPGGDKMSRHVVAAGDWNALLGLLLRAKAKAEARLGKPVGITAIHEAGLDGFSVHRMLEKNGVESHVVDPASIAVPRRKRRAKSDRIDGETLLRALLAHKRGEPRVCSMVVPPSPEDEDRRRLSRERHTLVSERVQHTDRIRGMLMAEGIADYDPLHRDRRGRLDALRTADGRPLPPHLKARILREIERTEVLLRQIAEVEAERDALLRLEREAAAAPLLTRLKGIGAEFASVLRFEAFFRRFDNQRQLSAFAGLAPSPWKSGRIDREQGISQAGNPRLRTTAIELAWMWLRHQPGSALSRWFRDRVGAERGRARRVTIVALARKLLVALWRYATQGVIPDGAVMKAG
ncbi:MAG: IS110 family transposase [Pseudomonadota bacterium]|nr:IS110 family transposase [Pseudomonadota bacterium]